MFSKTSNRVFKLRKHSHQVAKSGLFQDRDSMPTPTTNVTPLGVHKQALNEQSETNSRTKLMKQRYTHNRTRDGFLPNDSLEEQSNLDQSPTHGGSGKIHLRAVGSPLNFATRL